MREILFRGKRIDNGEWVEGLLSQATVIPEEKGAYVATAIDKLVEKPFDGGWYEVAPETVGQYTGLRDSKRTAEYPEGQRIFEGDVVRCGTGRICKVEYRTTPCFCGFDLSSISGFDYPPPPEWNLFGDLEVVGNIIDTVRDFLEVNHDER